METLKEISLKENLSDITTNYNNRMKKIHLRAQRMEKIPVDQNFKGFKKEEVEQLIIEAIDKRLMKGTTAREAGADLANRFGKVEPLFTFDSNVGAIKDNSIRKQKQLQKNKERLEKKKKWQQERLAEVYFFTAIFRGYLSEYIGEHKTNQMGISIMVGDSIKIDKNMHYKRVY